MKALYRLVPASPERAEELARLWRLSIEKLCRRDHRGDPEILARWTGNKTVAGLAKAFADPALTWLLAEDEQGCLAGVGMFSDDGTVRALYVHPDRAGTGVGTMLMQAMEYKARRRGLSVLHLESTETAHGFYRRHGYTDTGPATSTFGVATFPMVKQLASGDPEIGCRERWNIDAPVTPRSGGSATEDP